MKTHAETKNQTSSRANARPLPNALANQTALRKALRRAGVQPRLHIGAADSPLEHEADAAARRVMHMRTPESALPADSRAAQGKLLQAKASAPSALPAGPASPQVEASLGSLDSGGSPLDAHSRAFFEPRFGQDFSHVRLHTGASAAHMADALGAKAFTLGNNIAFASGQCSASTATGLNLLGHELAHVIQQRRLNGRTPQAKLLQRQMRQPEEETQPEEEAPTPKEKLTKEEERTEAEIKKVSDGYLLNELKVPDEVAAALKAARQTEAIASGHQKRLDKTGTGTHYGTESHCATNPRCDKSELEATNCILFQLNPVETYLRAREASGNLPKGTWDSVRAATHDSSGNELLKNGKERPRTSVLVGRDTALMEQLRQRAGFTTMLIDRGEMVGQRSLSKAVKAAGGYYPPVARLVKGAQSGESLDVRTHIDTSFENTQADRAAALEYLRSLPFAILTEDYGLHTLVLSFGVVYEAHWAAGPKQKVFERTNLESYLQRHQNLVVAVPPGYPLPPRPAPSPAPRRPSTVPGNRRRQ